MTNPSLGNSSRREEATVPKAKLLVVDEDLRDMCEYSGMLRERGYDVHGVCSYAEGAACLNRESVDLVIVSQGSPAFEGRGVLERAIKKGRHIPVLVLARSVEMGCYLEAMELGAFDYLEKPVSASQFLKLVATHLHNRH
jgi:two-component system response regulator (stage 0 sporulation protein F)